MSGFPVPPVRTGRLTAPSWPYHRSTSGSPIRQQRQQRQQPIDDLIPLLAPSTAVQSLRSPSGSLKRCLDTATSPEQSFAMRAALASGSIQEWWDELSQWPWPSGGGSAGFEEPPASRRTLGAMTACNRPELSTPSPTASPMFAQANPMTPEKQIARSPKQLGSAESCRSDDELWMGSLTAADVARYESRVAEVQQEIEELEVEDMKQRVLIHHILPLSPPSTPAVDGMPQRAVSVSSAKFVQMDDITAVITAIVLQALPVLSKLMRLLGTWHIRILILKKIPSFCRSLDAAEAAIESAWRAVRFDNEGMDAASLSSVDLEAQGLRRDEVSAMKAVVEDKVSKAAQAADSMLDMLDGWDDTIPDDWIDRIDTTEREYGEWVAFCERKLCASEWKTAFLNRPSLLPPKQEVSLLGYADDSLAFDNTPPSVDAAAIGFQTPPNLSPQSSFGSASSLSTMQHVASEPAPNEASSPTESIEVARAENTHERHLIDVPELGESSPPDFRGSIRSNVTFSDMPTVNEIPGEESPSGSRSPRTPMDTSFTFSDYDNDGVELPLDMSTPNSQKTSYSNEDDQLQHQISEILELIPAKIHLSSQPSQTLSHLNPPDFKMPRKSKTTTDGTRSTSSLSSRSGTPSFYLAPAFARNTRSRQQRSNPEIKLYHLSRSTGEAPIKLFIRLVGESGERVMVRVGGGWADLSEYLKEYASHHSRRSQNGSESKIEIDLPAASAAGSSPPSRPASALGSPVSTPPLIVRKTRRSIGEETGRRTPLFAAAKSETAAGEPSAPSRSSSRLSWVEEDSTLGMSGPRAKNIEMSKESKAWVESVKERVRIASGERKVSDQLDGKFGEMGKAGGTKRLYRKG